MPRTKKPSCAVCGQRRCVQSAGCVEYRTKGTLNGVPTQIIRWNDPK